MKAFEKQLNICKRDLERQELQYFEYFKLRHFYTEIEINEAVVKEAHLAQMMLFLQTIDTTIEQFVLHYMYVHFRKFEETAKFIKYPDTVDFENLDLTMFTWMELLKS